MFSKSFSQKRIYERGYEQMNVVDIYNLYDLYVAYSKRLTPLEFFMEKIYTYKEKYPNVKIFDEIISLYSTTSDKLRKESLFINCFSLLIKGEIRNLLFHSSAIPNIDKKYFKRQ